MEALDVSSVRAVIRLADTCYPQEFGDHVTSPAGVTVEDLLIVSPEEKALMDKVSSLGKPAIIELCALMWLGRGAGGEEAEDWSWLVSEAKSQYGDNMVSYITEKSPLAEYLRDGLRKLSVDG